MEPTNDRPTPPSPPLTRALVDAIAERVAALVTDGRLHARLRADVCMGDDMVVTEEEADSDPAQASECDGDLEENSMSGRNS